MKKYRSLWYKSTANHNILYFVRIPGISFRNTGNCLWKAQNTLARRAVAPSNLLQILCNPGSARRLFSRSQA
jgi:hypothetical protein